MDANYLAAPSGPTTIMAEWDIEMDERGFGGVEALVKNVRLDGLRRHTENA